ncbi:hypothetical protein E3N88_34111 [Mikania micrantha]|uniref:Tr-type G domain-containing protein n=1 Tax=Mikania micrantha TaxID=192012 RepID=A0A5N6MDG7_9ASTR|nr:hypothetical protein E3N88_34111 [Mikania micrantha]
MLKQAKVFRHNQVVEERIMDSNDLERERGITILSKNTSITYKDTKMNIIDTPGHSDFGGEVDHVLNMVEGVLLVVDSVEGPMPQTRFVLKKALEFGHAVVVVLNKIDRPSARPEYVINSTFELFIELNTSDEQVTFTSTEYDEHKGKIAIGRLHAGVLKRGMDVRICTSDDACRFGKFSELFVFEKFFRAPAESVEAGDICVVCGLGDIQIGETIADKNDGKALPAIRVELWKNQQSKWLSLSTLHHLLAVRNLRDRLYREIERNLAMKVEDGETADTFLIATVVVPEEHMGSVVELLGKRRGQMLDMQGLGPEGTTLLKYKIPTRGLLGLRNAILTASRGTAILNTIFDSYGPWAGEMSTRDLGSLVAFEDGTSTSYALASSQERGQLFITPGVEVYKCHIVGIHQRPGDLALNVCEKKAATNVRSNKEVSVVLDTPLDYSLDDCIEYIQEDELVEVTPKSTISLDDL